MSFSSSSCSRWEVPLFLLLALVGGMMFGACRTASERGENTLTVYAASSLMEVFTALGKEFEAGNPGKKVVFNFAGSHQLAQQLALGAPGDVLATASEVQMQKVAEAGRVAQDSVRLFATNRLVVIFPDENPAGIRTLQDLAGDRLSLILAAPGVPVGAYAVRFLEEASRDPAFGSDYKERVLANVVSYEQSVRAVFVKVMLGEADAGIVYASDLYSRHAERPGHLDVPDWPTLRASYAIAPVSGDRPGEAASAFIQFVLSGRGRALLEQHGFEPVGS